MSRYSEVCALMDADLKAEAVAALDERGMSASDFIRSALIHLIETGEVPFKIRKLKPGKPFQIAARSREEVRA